MVHHAPLGKESNKSREINVQNDTIAALSTPFGRGGVAIIRISGSLVQDIAARILGKLPHPRYATFSVFLDFSGQKIDEGIALFFPAPNSFTGEDVLELHGHGGPIVVDSLMKTILLQGARVANPGEFSLRAFLNDKIDLAQAEAIADLIDASSEQAARSALRSLQGEFSKKIHMLVDAIIRLRAYVEAAIDFAEEEIDFLRDQQIVIDLDHIIDEIKKIRASASQGSLLREGITAVIAGKPNVGKSSLLNRLSGKEIAIVTEVPGTTRDLLHDNIIIDGLSMHVIDTAGLRESNDVVEQEGIRRTREEIANADFVLHVVDATYHTTENISDFLEKIPEHAVVITIRNKIDLTNESPALLKKENKTIVSLSAKNGDGIELLKNHIKTCVGFHISNEGVFSARRRHLDALDRAQNLLENGRKQLEQQQARELFAEDLRQAQNALNEITGEFTSDDLLGKIFSSFCIGK
jgi:tRNA modification GTPase